MLSIESKDICFLLKIAKLLYLNNVKYTIEESEYCTDYMCVNVPRPEQKVKRRLIWFLYDTVIKPMIERKR